MKTCIEELDCVADDAIDIIFSLVDTMLCAGEFDLVDSCLKEDPPQSFHLTIAMLSITLAAKDKLPNRALYCKKVRERLGKDADSLLAGLE